MQGKTISRSSPETRLALSALFVRHWHGVEETLTENVFMMFAVTYMLSLANSLNYSSINNTKLKGIYIAPSFLEPTPRPSLDDVGDDSENKKRALQHGLIFTRKQYNIKKSIVPSCMLINQHCIKLMP